MAPPVTSSTWPVPLGPSYDGKMEHYDYATRSAFYVILAPTASYQD